MTDARGRQPPGIAIVHIVSAVSVFSHDPSDPSIGDMISYPSLLFYFQHTTTHLGKLNGSYMIFYTQYILKIETTRNLQEGGYEYR